MEVVHTLSPRNARKLKNVVKHTALSRAVPSTNRSDLGRRKAWIDYEANFSSKTYTRTKNKEGRALSSYLRNLATFYMSETYFHALAFSSHAGRQIGPHRDAVGNKSVLIINLGEVALCTEKKTLELHGGELVLMNRLDKHWSEFRDESRIGVACWAKNPRWQIEK